LKDFRKNITIEFLNEAGQVAFVYRVYRCWVSEYQALPDLDANAGGVAIESIVLQHEGWQRDEGVGEPTEQSL
jgi:phage tail-like protein